MMAMGRSQLVPVLAIGLLLFVWTLRWQMSSLTFDYSWVGGSNEDDVSAGGSAATPGLPSPPSSPPPQPAAGARPPAHGQGRPLPTDVDLSDPDAPFVGWPLRRACDEVEAWVDGVTFVCDSNFGGVGNLRNFVLTCVRYAIEAGATGLVMPAIRKRKDDDIKVIFHRPDLRPFGYLFDEENFRRAMGENCPRMTLYDDIPSVPNVRYVDGATPDVETLDPRQMGREWGKPEKGDFAELDHHTDRFGGELTFPLVLSRCDRPLLLSRCDRPLFFLDVTGHARHSTQPPPPKGAALPDDERLTQLCYDTSVA